MFSKISNRGRRVCSRGAPRREVDVAVTSSQEASCKHRTPSSCDGGPAVCWRSNPPPHEAPPRLSLAQRFWRRLERFASQVQTFAERHQRGGLRNDCAPRRGLLTSSLLES